MTSEFRAMLGELAVLADRVDRDERRLEVADNEEERQVLFKVVDQARAVLDH